jgi:hypothetical protein
VLNSANEVPRWPIAKRRPAVYADVATTPGATAMTLRHIDCRILGADVITAQLLALTVARLFVAQLAAA